MKKRGHSPPPARPTAQECTKLRTSPRRQWLIELMQTLGHGRIEGLIIRDREPMVDPPPRVVHDIKFGGENGSRPELGRADFALKSQVIELFDYFDNAVNVTIDVLEIKNGLPFRMLVTEVAA